MYFVFLISHRIAAVSHSTENIMRSLVSTFLCLAISDISNAGRGLQLLETLQGAGDVPCDTDHVDIIVAGYNNMLGIYSVTDEAMPGVKLECNFRLEREQSGGVTWLPCVQG